MNIHDTFNRLLLNPDPVLIERFIRELKHRGIYLRDYNPEREELMGLLDRCNCIINIEDVIPDFANLGNCSLTDVSAIRYLLKYFPQIKRISINKNRVKDISPVGELLGLASFAFSHNNVEDLTPILPLKDSLTFLNCSNNPLKSLYPLQKFVNLETLYICDFEFEDVEIFSSLKKLSHIYMSYRYVSNDVRRFFKETNIELHEVLIDS